MSSSAGSALGRRSMYFTYTILEIVRRRSVNGFFGEHGCVQLRWVQITSMLEFWWSLQRRQLTSYRPRCEMVLNFSRRRSYWEAVATDRRFFDILIRTTARYLRSLSFRPSIIASNPNSKSSSRVNLVKCATPSRLALGDSPSIAEAIPSRSIWPVMNV